MSDEHESTRPLLQESDRGWQLFQQIRASEGELIHWKKEALRASYFVFSANYAELINSVKHLERDQKWLRTLRNRDALETFQMNNLRLMHNFLASAFTLVDHTRILARELYSGKPFYAEYEHQTKQVFSHSPTAGFVKGLRNWMLHKGLVPVMIETKVGAEETFVSSIVFDLKELASWDRWDSRAKEYLASITANPRLDDVISAYHKQIEGFYSWLDQRMGAIHAAAFAEWVSLQEQYRRTVSGAR